MKVTCMSSTNPQAKTIGYVADNIYYFFISCESWLVKDLTPILLFAVKDGLRFATV
uniref:Uncharacterized protein n=1 Tax=Mammaliicoccus phage MSShimriz1 TaxID=3230127 RepID=A0AAU8GVC2_9VIRU